MICRWTPEHSLLFASDAYCRFVGRPWSQLAGSAITHHISDADRDKLHAALDRLAVGIPYTDVECRVQTDGGIRWTHWTLLAVFDDADRICMVQSIIRDITSRKRMVENLRDKQQVLERIVHYRTRELDEKHHQLVRKNQQFKHLVRKTQHAMENDRQSIAKELHDSIGASLAAIKFSLEQRLSEMEKMPRSKRLSFEQILSYLTDTIKETKRISHGLRPSTLDHLGLLVTLKDHTRKLEEIYPHISFHTTFAVAEDMIPEPLKIVIYRVVQEAANNACRHSGGDTVHIRLGHKDGNLTLSIQDNGCGFIVSGVRGGKTDLDGYGLQGMRDRVEIFDGDFTINSRPSGGTCVAVTLPTAFASGEYSFPG